MTWKKVASVWIGIPSDSGTIRGGIRCYLIDIDWTKEHVGTWTLRAVRDEGDSEEVEVDEGRYPNEAIDRLQKRAEEHYMGQGW